MARIELKQLHKYYGKVHAVRGIDLYCEDGEFVAFLGPSGCGKSTTMRMIAGLEDISAGDIFLGDRLINHLPPNKRDIAMVFENYALYPHKTVFENIASPLILKKTPAAEIKKAVEKVSATLSLDSVLHKYPGGLSDGQKQRIGIGRAIIRRPSAFLFDEPISHLDTVLRQQMRKEIKHLQKELKITMIYVTHDQLEALSMADRIAVMNDGLLQQFGTREEIFNSPNNTFVAKFVGEPPINLLPASLSEKADGKSLLVKPFGSEILLTGERSARVLKSAKNPSSLTIGIRPGFIELSGTEVSNSFFGVVTFVEELDEYNIITVKVGEERILVETAMGRSFAVNDKVWASFPEESLHFFDEESGTNCLL